jgi:phosphatidylcholine synthase
MTSDPHRYELLQPSAWRWLAGSVHLFTALGVVCALLAVHALLDRDFEMAFIWLGLAMIIDGVDGFFARAVDVKGRLPRFSGEKLDLVVDYVTYVFVPVLALQLGGYLTGTWGGLLGGLILLSSLFHFSDNGNKADDHCFVGFPAIWNVVAFYVFALELAGWAVILLVLICVVGTFVPMRWLHPMRVRALRPVNLAMSGLWAVAAVWTVAAGFPGGLITNAALALVAVYGIGLSLLWPVLGGGDDAQAGHLT